MSSVIEGIAAEYQSWMSRKQMSVAITDSASGFIAAMAAYLLEPSEIISDGNFHRFATAEDKGRSKSGWYAFHDTGNLAYGSFGDWRTGLSESWCSKRKEQVSPGDWQKHIELMQQAKAQADAELIKLQEKAASLCTDLWDNASPAPEDHPYLRLKGIEPHGIKYDAKKGRLLVPMRDVTGNITSIQSIYNPDKNGKTHKNNFFGGKIKGSYYSFGGKPAHTLLICEGFATGASLHQSTGYPVAVAFSTGNMEAVAVALRATAIKIIICADNDKKTERKTGINGGIVAATKAAQAVSGLIAIPHFQSDDINLSDFNDLHQSEGLQAVKAIIDKASSTAPEAAQSGIQQNGWPEPEPLIRSTTAAPYPVDALPAVIRAAVEEVQGFTKAPLAMVACSALANLSLAAQAHHDVQRAEKLTGATGLYFLVIAESGERKSTCDGIFSKVLRDYEAKQQEEAKQDIKHYAADKAAWDAVKSGILDAIKQAAKSGKDAGLLDRDLRSHEERQPEAPRVPRLIYSDFTPEALTYSLAKHWPSGGVMSSEAGAVFGSHGMGKDSQLRNFAILNQLWDGSKLTFDRRGESYQVEGARLTISLQVQESALLEFFHRTGQLARGTGFLARFLIAHPKSTQGDRLFTDPPANMPALASYHSQLSRILQTKAPINDLGGLEPSMLTLSPEAKAAWVRFHDEIEKSLGNGGELQDIRDVASKIADNAARLAALFHVIDGSMGAISLDHFESASIVAAWHLNEALRFFGALALPEALVDAARLDDWLIGYCRTHGADTVSTRCISQYAPYKLRQKDKLTAAMQELIELGRIMILQSGKKREIQINPQLLEG